MVQADDVNFTGSTKHVSCQALLFDMDGTIIDSTAAVVRHWHSVGEEIGVNGDVILRTSHGRRSIDVLKLLKPELANWEYVSRKEGEIPEKYGSDAVELPGSRKLLDQVSHLGVPWSIVTSGTRPLVYGWLDRMKLAKPDTMVTAEDVANGKPDPACYKLGAERVESKYGLSNNPPENVIVFEDAPAGIKSGKAAGFKVVGLVTTHDVKSIRDAGADLIVKDLKSVSLKEYDAKTGFAQIEISNTLIE